MTPPIATPAPAPDYRPPTPPAVEVAAVVGTLARLLAAGDQAGLVAAVRRLYGPALSDPDLVGRIGRLLREGREPGLAVEMLGMAIPRVTAPGSVRASLLVELAGGWIDLAEPGQAARAVDDALALDPTHPGALNLRQALAAGAGQVPSLLAVRSLFDAAAAHFDTHLAGIGYAAPGLLADLLRRAGIGPGAGLDMLDAGCGTGLMGPHLRGLAARLEGVDLSAAMLARAREIGCYDRLDQGDLVEVARARPGSYGLITAADVLIYLPDLRPVFAALVQALRPGGLLAATVERGEGASTRLGPGARWAHGPDHVIAAADAAGLEPVSMEPATLRRESGQPVIGLAFLLRRPAAS